MKTTKGVETLYNHYSKSYYISEWRNEGNSKIIKYGKTLYRNLTTKEEADEKLKEYYENN